MSASRALKSSLNGLNIKMSQPTRESSIAEAVAAGYIWDDENEEWIKPTEN